MSTTTVAANKPLAVDVFLAQLVAVIQQAQDSEGRLIRAKNARSSPTRLWSGSYGIQSFRHRSKSAWTTFASKSASNPYWMYLHEVFYLADACDRRLQSCRRRIQPAYPSSRSRHART